MPNEIKHVNGFNADTASRKNGDILAVIPAEMPAPTTGIQYQDSLPVFQLQNPDASTGNQNQINTDLKKDLPAQCAKLPLNGEVCVYTPAPEQNTENNGTHNSHHIVFGALLDAADRLTDARSVYERLLSTLRWGADNQLESEGIPITAEFEPQSGRMISEINRALEESFNQTGQKMSVSIIGTERPLLHLNFSKPQVRTGSTVFTADETEKSADVHPLSKKELDRINLTDIELRTIGFLSDVPEPFSVTYDSITRMFRIKPEQGKSNTEQVGKMIAGINGMFEQADLIPPVEIMRLPGRNRVKLAQVYQTPTRAMLAEICSKVQKPADKLFSLMIGHYKMRPHNYTDIKITINRAWTVIDALSNDIANSIRRINKDISDQELQQEIDSRLFDILRSFERKEVSLFNPRAYTCDGFQLRIQGLHSLRKYI